MTEKKSMADFSDVFKAYERAFPNPFAGANPLADWFGKFGAENFDPQKLMKDNQDRIEALTRANQEAAAAYQSQVQRQAEIFAEIMKAAQDSVGKLEFSGQPEAMKKNFDTYSEAVETATRLMQRLSEETRAATEAAYSKIAKDVEAAIGSMRTK